MPSETPEGRDAEQAARRQLERLNFELYRADRNGRQFIQEERARREATRAAAEALPPPAPRPPPVITVSETIFEPLRKGGSDNGGTPPPAPGGISGNPYSITICDKGVDPAAEVTIIVLTVPA